MARFRGSVVGQRGDGASRLGSLVSGLSTQTNGWDSGVTVFASALPDGRDCFEVFATGGSNGGGRDFLIARVVGGEVELDPYGLVADQHAEIAS